VRAPPSSTLWHVCSDLLSRAAYCHVHRMLPPSAMSACNFLRSPSPNPPPGPPTCGCSASSALGFRSVLSAGPLGEVAAACFCCWALLVLLAFTARHMGRCMCSGGHQTLLPRCIGR